MALGHALQHIAELYERQTAAHSTSRKMQAQLDYLENRARTLQAEIDRLTHSLSKP